LTYQILADKKWLEHLFDNVFKNALDEVEINGSKIVELKINTDGDNVLVSIFNK
jgi:C4-dicarboxylate-specific signal transduction histidine kinase